MQNKAPGAQPRAGGSPHHRDCLFARFRWQGADVLDHRFHFPERRRKIMTVNAV